MGVGELIGAAPHKYAVTHDLLVQLSIELGIAIVIVVVTFTVARFTRGRLRQGLQRTGMASNVAVLLARFLWLGVWLIGIIAILDLVGLGLTPLAAFIGVLGLAASLALQQVLQNLVAGVYLLAERPFAIGDLISVVGPAGLNHQGTVEDIQMRTTHLRNRQAELILVPNSAIFAGVVTNQTVVGGSVLQMALTFPRTVPPDDAERRLIDVLRAQPGVLATPGPELALMSVDKDTWKGSLVFWSSHPGADSTALWAVAQAYPEATVESGAPTAS